MGASVPQRTVLVVDDNEDFAAVLGEHLEGKGYKVIFAFDGLAASTQAQKHKPDLIVLDYHIPLQMGSRFTKASGIHDHILDPDYIYQRGRDFHGKKGGPGVPQGPLYGKANRRAEVPAIRSRTSSELIPAPQLNLIGAADERKFSGFSHQLR